jgi:hypothetical protein
VSGFAAFFQASREGDDGWVRNARLRGAPADAALQRSRRRGWRGARGAESRSRDGGCLSFIANHGFMIRYLTPMDGFVPWLRAGFACRSLGRCAYRRPPAVGGPRHAASAGSPRRRLPDRASRSPSGRPRRVESARNLPVAAPVADRCNPPRPRAAKTARRKSANAAPRNERPSGNKRGEVRELNP